MKRFNKKAQVEEFFDDLIAFGLLAIVLIVFIIYISGLNANAEKAYHDSKDDLLCNEQLTQFLRTNTIINGEKLTMYELASRVLDREDKAWFIKKAKDYFGELDGKYYVQVDTLPDQLSGVPLFGEQIGETSSSDVNCEAIAYLALNTTKETHKDIQRNYIKIKIKGW